VFEVRYSEDHRHVIYKLVFHSPNNAYDRQWFIEGWDGTDRTGSFAFAWRRDTKAEMTFLMKRTGQRERRYATSPS
jgi:hypothetical protein